QPDKMFDELRDAAHAQPPHHLRRDFVADEIGKNGGVTGVQFYGVGNGAGNFISGRSFAEGFDVFGPGQSDERAYSGFGAGTKKPARGTVINANNVKPGCTNLDKIARGLFSCSKIIA